VGWGLTKFVRGLLKLLRWGKSDVDVGQLFPP
jgi:hypothetical protein